MNRLDGATAEVRDRARRVADEEKAQRRNRESACAIDFIVNGNEDGRHAKYATKLGVAPFSRDYQPEPYPEARPFPESAYEGTGIGLLYGLTDPETYADRHAVFSLAGWNLIGPRERLIGQQMHAHDPKENQ